MSRPAAGSSPSSRDALFLGLLPSIIALAWFVQKGSHFWRERPDLQFGWAILLLFLYLIWETLDRHCLQPQLQISGLSVAVFLLAGLGCLESQVYEQAFGPTSVSMFLLGCSLIAAMAVNARCVVGWPGLKQLLFSLLFLGLALPIPEAVYYPIVSTLQSSIATATVDFLKLCGVPAQRSGTIIHLGNAVVGVDEACSGIRSLQSSVMATLFLGHLLLRSRAVKCLLVGFGIALAVIGNFLRSCFLSYTAYAKGTEGFSSIHDAAGWSILAFTAAGVACFAWLFSKVELRARNLPVTSKV